MLSTDYAEKVRGVQGLVAFQSTDPGAGLTAAVDTAKTLVPEEHHGPDIYVASPESGKWTIDEIGEQLLHQQAYEPMGDMRVVVVDRAHRMDKRAHDHLLKTVEEPPAAVLFIFVVESADALPVTIQSRVYTAVSVPPRSVEDVRREVQAKAGVDASGRMVELVQSSPQLSAGLNEYAVSAVQEAVEHAGAVNLSALGAFKLARAAEEAGAAAVGKKKDSPEAKSAGREIGGVLLDMRYTQLKQQAAENGSLDAMRLLDRTLEARRMVNMYIPMDQAFTYSTLEV